MRFLCFFVMGFLTFLSNAQNENYTISKLNINDERPHFSINFSGGNKVVYLSYLLNKNGKIKTVLGIPTLTIFEGQVDNKEIIKEPPVLIDSKQSIMFLVLNYLQILSGCMLLLHTIKGICQKAILTKRIFILRLESI